jgi:hypothetical protein
MRRLDRLDDEVFETMYVGHRRNVPRCVGALRVGLARDLRARSAIGTSGNARFH